MEARYFKGRIICIPARRIAISPVENHCSARVCLQSVRATLFHGKASRCSPFDFYSRQNRVCTLFKLHKGTKRQEQHTNKYLQSHPNCRARSVSFLTGSKMALAVIAKWKVAHMYMYTSYVSNPAGEINNGRSGKWSREAGCYLQISAIIKLNWLCINKFPRHFRENVNFFTNWMPLAFMARNLAELYFLHTISRLDKIGFALTKSLTLSKCTWAGVEK